MNKPDVITDWAAQPTASPTLPKSSCCGSKRAEDAKSADAKSNPATSVALSADVVAERAPEAGISKASSCCNTGKASQSETVPVSPAHNSSGSGCCSTSQTPSALPGIQVSSGAEIGKASAKASGFGQNISQALVNTARLLTAPVLAIIAIIAFLAVAMPAQAWETLSFTGRAFSGILPFFAISIALAAGAVATGAGALVGRAFSGREGRSIIVAALVGAMAPFCSCGVIPVVTAFLMAGVPLAPVMAFWISSPLMDPNMFVLTAGGLGLEFAVVKTFAAIGMGLFAGYATQILLRNTPVKSLLKIEIQSGCGCKGSKPNEADIRWRFWEDPVRAQSFLKVAGYNTWFLGRWLALAFVLESLMVTFVPASLVTAWLGGDGALAIPLAVGLGIPAYLNGYAAIPLVAGLIKLGMSPAVGLGFMLGGGVTSVPAAMAVWAVAKPRLFGLYLGLAFIGSLGAAYAYAFAITLRG